MSDDKEYGVATGAVVAALNEIRDEVKQLHDRMERPAPRVWATPFLQTHARLRTEWWVVTLSAAGTAALQVGTATVYTVQVAAAETKVIPLPLTIDRGAGVTVVGANVVDSILIGYTE